MNTFTKIPVNGQMMHIMYACEMLARQWAGACGVNAPDELVRQIGSRAGSSICFALSDLGKRTKAVVLTGGRVKFGEQLYESADERFLLNPGSELTLVKKIHGDEETSVFINENVRIPLRPAS